MTVVKTKMNAMTQNTPKSQKAPYDPINASRDENHLVTANPKIQQTHVQIEDATDFMLGENISPATAQGKGPNLNNYNS